MKALILLFVLCAAPLIALTGCGKKEGVASMTPYEISGVKVDIPKLQQAFANSPDLQPELNQAVSQLRYGQYLNTMQGLDKLAGNPALNDAQKKALATVIDQMKEVINKAGPSRQ